MHIPRQYGPAEGALTPEAQRHREHLEHELRRTAYWRRLVQARLDLVVAGLLYAAPAPSPAATAGMVRSDPLRPARRAGDEAADEVSALSFEAPLGLDVSYLLDGGSADRGPDWRSGATPPDTGTRLDRLRQVLRLLTDAERALVAELHAVTPALREEVDIQLPVAGG